MLGPKLRVSHQEQISTMFKNFTIFNKITLNLENTSIAQKHQFESEKKDKGKIYNNVRRTQWKHAKNGEENRYQLQE